MMTKSEAIRRAAEILREEAEIIRESHTVDGEWRGDRAAREAHDEMLAVAQALEQD